MASYGFIRGSLQRAVDDSRWREFLVETLKVTPPEGQTAFDCLVYNEALTSKQIDPELRTWLEVNFDGSVTQALFQYYNAQPPVVEVEDVSVVDRRRNSGLDSGSFMRFEFMRVKQTSKVNPGNSFWEFYCYQVLQKSPPPGQASFDFLQDIGSLTILHIDPTLKAWLTAHYPHNLNIRKLLCYYENVPWYIYPTVTPAPNCYP